MELASKVTWEGQSQVIGTISVAWAGKGNYAAVVENEIGERTYYPVEEGVNFGVGPTVKFDSLLDIFKKWSYYSVVIWLMEV